MTRDLGIPASFTDRFAERRAGSQHRAEPERDDGRLGGGEPLTVHNLGNPEPTREHDAVEGCDPDDEAVDRRVPAEASGTTKVAANGTMSSGANQPNPIPAPAITPTVASTATHHQS